MFSVALVFAQSLLWGVPAATTNVLDSARSDAVCFAFAVSYSEVGKGTLSRRALVTAVIRYTVADAGTCHRNESEIRSQLDLALSRPGSTHARTHYTAPVVYTYPRATTARLRRSQVIDQIELGWTVVEFDLVYVQSSTSPN